jgi:signal transduction histidine kinase/CheY-like chemotaxis protein
VNLRLRVILLTLAILVPAFAAGAWVITTNVRRSETTLRGEVLNRAHAMVVSMNQEFERRESLLQLLAGSPELLRWDLPAFCALARSAVRDSTGPIAIVDRENVVMWTRTPDCSPEPGQKNMVPQSFAVEGVTVSDLFMSLTGESLITINFPIDLGGRRLNLAMGVPPATLQRMLEEHKQPDGWDAAVVNASGRVIARFPDPDRWVGRMGAAYSENEEQIRSDWKRRAPNGKGTAVGKSANGAAVNVVYSSSDRYGLTVFIGFPQAFMEAAAHQTVREEALGASLLMAFGLLLAMWAGRRIAEPAAALRAAADDLKSGKPVVLARSNVAEFDRIASALEDASETIRTHSYAQARRVAAAVADAEASQAKLVQAQKLEVIGRLTGGIAHDFNNLLQTLSTGLTVLEQTVTDTRSRPLIAAGLRAVNRAARLVQQLLAFGRNAPFARQSVDLHSHLLAMEVLLSKTLAENLRLHIDLAPDLWRIETDPGQLEVALLNLVFNARDALPAGGEITLRASNEIREGREGVMLSVSDTGVGIEPALLPQVFEPFITTKPVGMGAGLGLSQVRDFALNSGGAVCATSTVGAGTTVLLWLPRATSEVIGETHAAPLRAAPQGCRVLFVEDDVLIAEVVTSALRGAGFEVLLRATAEDALALLRAGEDIDVVFSDVIMPGSMSGLQLAQQLGQEFPRLPVILSSGYAEQLESREPFVVLSKPYSVQRLVEELLAAVRSSGESRPVETGSAMRASGV